MTRQTENKETDKETTRYSHVKPKAVVNVEVDRHRQTDRQTDMYSHAPPTVVPQ